MKKFVLTVGKTLTKDIVFDLLDTDISYRWAAEIDKNYQLFETNRFKGWPNNGKNLEYFYKNLQKQINIVNNYRPNTINFQEEFNQDTLNYLHKFFEELRGHAIDGTVFFNNAPEDVKNAIIKFNVLIHECEHFIRDKDNPTIVGTYKNRPRYDLEKNDYKLFTFQWKFGYVYINYCEVGKPLLDVFKDNDSIIGKDNIRPLKYYSADFMIKFGIDTPLDIYENRLKQFYKWLENQNHNFDELSLGLIPVAKLNIVDSNFKNYSHLEIINNISSYLEIKSSCIK